MHLGELSDVSEFILISTLTCKIQCYPNEEIIEAVCPISKAYSLKLQNKSTDAIRYEQKLKGTFGYFH